MATHNEVILNAWVTNDPQVQYDSENNPVSAIIIVRTVRGVRSNGEALRKLQYDNQPVMSEIPAFVKKIAALKKGDIVEIKGFLASRNSLLNIECPYCSSEITHKVVWQYVNPIFIKKRAGNIPESNIPKVLKELCELSNHALFMGYVCVEPTKGYASDIANTKYVIGIKRKYRIRGNNPEIEAKERTDYLNVKTFGIQAEKDEARLDVGSRVYLDGAIQTRWGYAVTKHCDCCGEDFTYTGMHTTEILPYSVEYLDKKITDEEIKGNNSKIEESDGEENVSVSD